MGTGFYLFSFVAEVLEAGLFAVPRQGPYGLLAPVLVVLGFLALASEAGSPSKGFYLFRGYRSAWLSRETLLWSLFLPIAVLDWFLPNPFLRLLSVGFAVALMVSQGFILYQIKAVAGWHVPIMPVFFISSGFASGASLFLLIGGLAHVPLMLRTILIAMTAVSANLVIWLFYLYRSQSGVFAESTKSLRRPLYLILILGLGHGVPLCFLAVLAMGGRREAGHMFDTMLICTDLLMLAGVILQKRGILQRAAKMKAITIEAFSG